jgi:hypothetical protein
MDGAYHFLNSPLKDLILKLTIFPNRFHILSVSSILSLELDSLMKMFNDLIELGFLQVSSDPFMYGKSEIDFYFKHFMMYFLHFHLL